MQKDPWYKTSGEIITLLFLFFPAGLFLMWQYAKWGPKTKWIVTGILAFLVVVSAISNTAEEKTRYQRRQRVPRRITLIYQAIQMQHLYQPTRQLQPQLQHHLRLGRRRIPTVGMEM